jgi:hypothetical protein
MNTIATAVPKARVETVSVNTCPDEVRESPACAPAPNALAKPPPMSGALAALRAASKNAPWIALQPSYQRECRASNLDDQHHPHEHQHVGEYLPRRPAPLFGVDAHPHSLLSDDAGDGDCWAA